MSGIGNLPAADPERTRYRFPFGPFQFESEIDIPELRSLGGSGRIPVRILCGGVPSDIVDAVSFDPVCRVSANEYLLDIAGVARFYVVGGSEVRVELVPDAPAADVSTFLLGSVFGALCHQNGLLPLHASAVAVDGRVTAFLGHSGAGKSTLAACLQGRGYRVVADDICVLEGAASVVPVAGWLKLWRASLNHLGETPDERNRVYSADEKYRLYLESGAADQPALTNVIVLTRGDAARIEPLTVPETIASMMELIYLGYIPHLTGGDARCFLQCARALNGARGYRVVAPWGFERMDEVLDLLQRTILNPLIA
jgi:hypothetical protein